VKTAVAFSKEDGLQVGLANAIELQLVSGTRSSWPRLGPFRPRQYRRDARLFRLTARQISILELDPPIILGDVSGFACAQERRIDRLALLFSRTRWIVTCRKNQKIAEDRCEADVMWGAHAKERSVALRLCVLSFEATKRTMENF